jgi:hypothetical protein
MTTFLVDSYTQLLTAVTSWYIQLVYPMADENPFHPTCGGVEPFRPTIVTAVNWGLGIVDTIAVILGLFLVGRWMFGRNVGDMKWIGIIIVGLILLNGALITIFGAFGFHLGCLVKN